jgi:pilus assembly protein Flp/PilA
LKSPAWRDIAGFGNVSASANLKRRQIEGERMLDNVMSLIRDEEGATMVEYGLLVALIAMVALVAVTVLGKNLSTLFSNVATSV